MKDFSVNYYNQYWYCIEPMPSRIFLWFSSQGLSKWPGLLLSQWLGNLAPDTGRLPADACEFPLELARRSIEYVVLWLCRITGYRIDAQWERAGHVFRQGPSLASRRIVCRTTYCPLRAENHRQWSGKCCCLELLVHVDIDKCSFMTAN